MINFLFFIAFVIVALCLFMLKEMINSLKEFVLFRRIEVDNEIVLLKAQTEYLLKTVESLKIENSNLSIANSNLSIELLEAKIKAIDDMLRINKIISSLSENMIGVCANIDKRFSLTAQGLKSVDDRFKIVADSLEKVDKRFEIVAETFVEISDFLMDYADKG